MSKMNSNQWIALECLVALAAIGIASFFWEPKYGAGLGMIIAAVIAALNHALGVQSGQSMPEQASDAEKTGAKPPAGGTASHGA